MTEGVVDDGLAAMLVVTLVVEFPGRRADCGFKLDESPVFPVVGAIGVTVGTVETIGTFTNVDPGDPVGTVTEDV